MSTWTSKMGLHWQTMDCLGRRQTFRAKQDDEVEAEQQSFGS